MHLLVPALLSFHISKKRTVVKLGKEEVSTGENNVEPSASWISQASHHTKLMWLWMKSFGREYGICKSHNYSCPLRCYKTSSLQSWK